MGVIDENARRRLQAWLDASRADIPIAGARLSLAMASSTADAVTLSVRADSGDRYLGTNGVSAELWWDPAMFVFDAWQDGDWLEQGSLVEWHVGLIIPGKLSIAGTRPTTAGNVKGNGELLRVRLKLATGVRSGSSRFQWNAPTFFNGILQTLAGTIAVQ